MPKKRTIAFKKTSDNPNDKNIIMVSLKDEKRRKEQQKLYSPIRHLSIGEYLWMRSMEQATYSSDMTLSLGEDCA